jgi:hypothetical protein
MTAIVPGLDIGSAAARTTATLVKIIFFMYYFSFLVLVVRYDVWAVKSQVLDRKHVKSVSRPDLERWSD